MALKPLIDEVIDTAVVQASSRIVFYNHAPPGLEVDADRDQLFRILTNLARNAIQAIEGAQAEDERAPDGAVTLRAWREGTIVTIEVSDTGPGIPERVRDASVRSLPERGTAGRHRTGPCDRRRTHPRPWRRHRACRRQARTGTSFRLTIPDRVTELRAGRRGERRSAAEA